MKFEVVCETVVEDKAKMFRWFVAYFSNILTKQEVPGKVRFQSID